MKHFYSHVFETESLHIELSQLDLSSDEKEHLLQLIESNIHHTIIEAILSQLKEEDKKLFLTHVSCGEHDKIWNLLHLRIENIEEKIKQIADEVKKELRKDIRGAKKRV